MSENPKATNSAPKTVPVIERYPSTCIVVLVFLLMNFVCKVILDFANSMAEGGFNEAWAFAIPIFALAPLSFLVLFVGGGISIYADRARQKQHETSPSRASAGLAWLWIVGAVLLFPTVDLYRQLAPTLLGKPVRELNFVATASKAERVNKEYSELLDCNYQYEFERNNFEKRRKMEALLDAGADINSTGLYLHKTALALAATAGDEDFVRYLLAKGADVNASQFVPQNTALAEMLASKRTSSTSSKAKQRIALMLIKHGASRESLAQALTNEILYSRDKMLVSSLLDAGAPLNGDGTTQLPIIAAAARGDIELIDLLLKRGANVDASYSPGRTALFEALFSQKLGTAKFLIEHGANVNVADEAGTTYAMMAASWRNPEFLNCLLESGASVTAENRFGQGLLSNAARAGNLQRVQELMSRGARIDPKGKSGAEALRWAIEGNNPAIVSLFIKQGVDVNAHIPYESITLLQKAEQLGNQQIIALLRSAGARGN